MFELITGTVSFFIGVVGAILWVIPFFFIYRKLGFNPWLSLLWLFPPAGLVMTYIVAFGGGNHDDDDDF